MGIRLIPMKVNIIKSLQKSDSLIMVTDSHSLMWWESVGLSIKISYSTTCWDFLTHWGRVTHICIIKLLVTTLTIICSDNGLSPARHQAINWTNDGILLIGPVGTNFGEILIEIITFSFTKMRLKVSSAKRRPFCLGHNVLTPSVKLNHSFTHSTPS